MSATGFWLGIALALVALGVLASLVLPERAVPRAVGWTATLAAVGVCVAAGIVLATGREATTTLWRVRPLGRMALALDPLGALFLAVIGVVYVGGSIFAGSALGRRPPAFGVRAFAVMYLLLFPALVLVLSAGDVLSMAIGWEMMSLLLYLLVTTGSDHAWRQSYVMLALSETGTLALVIGLVLLAAAAGATDFAALRIASGGVGAPTRWAVFLLTFFGFGVKAGLVPVNMWLPGAYRVSPGAFSPVLAGATLNAGLYGILRVNGDLLPPALAGPGLLALVVGAITALIGILYATTENDLKVMLGHSSIENAGVVTAGFGAGFVFLATGHRVLGGMALVAALYHMANHATYKTLLFAGAVAVEGRTGERGMNRLGGIIRGMPWTAALFLIGALSISAMPPSNGFVSEWLTLQVLLRGVELGATGERLAFAVCGAALALTAALAVTCFVKAFAMTFLGVARSEPARQAVEAPRGVRAGMILLASACVLLGLLPTYVIPVLDRALPSAAHSATTALVPEFFHPARHPALPASFVADFRALGAQVGARVVPGRGLIVLHRGGEANPVVFAMSTTYMVAVLVLLLVGAYALAWLATRRRSVVRRPRWAGGALRHLPEMTYTATGFSNPVRVVFAAIFRPAGVEDTRNAVARHFLTAIRRQVRTPHLADRYALDPVVRGVRSIARLLARMHNGRVNAYTTYVLLTLLVLLLLARIT